MRKAVIKETYIEIPDRGTARLVFVDEKGYEYRQILLLENDVDAEIMLEQSDPNFNEKE